MSDASIEVECLRLDKAIGQLQFVRRHIQSVHAAAYTRHVRGEGGGKGGGKSEYYGDETGDVLARRTWEIVQRRSADLTNRIGALAAAMETMLNRGTIDEAAHPDYHLSRFEFKQALKLQEKRHSGLDKLVEQPEYTEDT